MAMCLDHFKNIDRTVEGYEGLLAAQDCFPTDEIRDKFAADYSYLSQHWEAISPTQCSKHTRKTTSGSHKSTNQSDPQAAEENSYGMRSEKKRSN